MEAAYAASLELLETVDLGANHELTEVRVEEALMWAESSGEPEEAWPGYCRRLARKRFIRICGTAILKELGKTVEEDGEAFLADAIVDFEKSFFGAYKSYYQRAGLATGSEDFPDLMGPMAEAQRHQM